MPLFGCLKKCCRPIPQRIVVATAVLSGTCLLYVHRLALNLAITEITFKVNVSEQLLSPDVCNYNDSSNADDESDGNEEFHWSATDQARILGVFYGGYLITHLPGGMIADKYGPKKVVAFAVFVTSICSLLTPIASRLNMYALVFLRAIMGLAQGPMFPAQSTFVARWSLPHERNMMNSYVNIGVVLGAILGNALTGTILHNLKPWDCVFYIYFGVSVIWFVFYIIFAHDDADKHPFISDEEKAKLNEALGDRVNTNSVKLKYGPLLKSIPVWATIIAEVGHDWAFFIIISLLPQYMGYVLKFNVSHNGLLNCLPYIAMSIVQMTSARLAQCLITKEYMTKTTQCKIYFLIANQGPCLCFVAASYAGCSRVAVVALFTLSMGIMGMIYPSLRVVNVDMAPNYAGFLMALMNGAGSLGGFVGPSVFALFIHDQTVAEWRMAFFLSTVLVTVTTVIYLIWGTSELQPWNTLEQPQSQAENAAEEQPPNNKRLPKQE